MILLDTCVLIYDALSPGRLSAKARKLLDQGKAAGELACADISLWEVAMLVAKGRVEVATDSADFLDAMLAARAISVLPITPHIATLSAAHPQFQHADPADRLIAASAMVHKATLLTSDRRLLALRGLKAVW